jgi:hypothetical protein
MIEQHRRLQVERISNLSLASDLAAIHPHGIFVASLLAMTLRAHRPGMTVVLYFP